MLLKKTLMIAGLGLIALAPAAARAADGSLFHVKVVAMDFHNGRSKISTYRSEQADTLTGLQAFLTNNPCLTSAAEGAKKEITGIEQTAPYANALKNYSTKCGADTSIEPQFVISANLSTGVMNTAHQPASAASLSLMIVEPQALSQKTSRIIEVPISKKNSKSLEIRYSVNANDASCANLGAALSDVNVSVISSQVITALQQSATACASHQSAKNAVDDLLQKNRTDVNDLLGSEPANGPLTGLVQSGCWGAGCKVVTASQPH